MGLLEQLGTYLAARGCGTVGTDLFLGKLPEAGDSSALGLLEYAGEPAVQTMQRPVLETPRLQVCGRAQGYNTARARVQRVYELLDGYRGDAMPGVYWIEGLGPPFRIGTDERLRELVGWNLRCHRAHPAPQAMGGSDGLGVGIGDTEIAILPL